IAVEHGATAAQVGCEHVPAHIEAAVVVVHVVVARGLSAVQLADEVAVLVPQSAAAAARLSGAVLPVGDAPALGTAPVGLGGGVVVEGDLLDVAAGVVDAHVAGGRGAAAVPAAVIHVVACRRGGVQLQQGHVRPGAVGLEGGAGHALVGGAVLVLVARGAFPVEAEHPVVRAAAQAVVGGEEVGGAVLRAVVDQLAGAESAAAHHHHGHGADLVAPGIT